MFKKVLSFMLEVVLAFAIGQFLVYVVTDMIDESRRSVWESR